VARSAFIAADFHCFSLPACAGVQYVKEENRFLKDRLTGQRIRFTDAERRRVTRKAHALGRQTFHQGQR
jgi:hypothetical protein